MESLSALSYDGGGGTQMTQNMTQNSLTASDVTFEPQTSLDEYSEQSRSPKASKLELQRIIGCSSFLKMAPMRYDCHLLLFRPFWISKSDLKIDKKSVKNQPEHKQLLT